MSASVLESKIKDAITKFNERLNSGYPVTDEKALLINYMKKGLSGYFNWGFIGSLKKHNFSMVVDEGRLRYLVVSGDEVWMNERISLINTAIDNIEFESLYHPSMILGRFGVATQKLVNSVIDFKFD